MQKLSIIMIVCVFLYCVGCYAVMTMSKGNQLYPQPDLRVEIENTNKGRVYVIWPSAFFHRERNVEPMISVLRSDSRRIYIGELRIGKYLVWESDTGRVQVYPHFPRFRSPGVPNLIQGRGIYLNIDPGKVYYLQLKSGGVIKGGMELKELSPQEGKKKLTKCKPMELNKKKR